MTFRSQREVSIIWASHDKNVNDDAGIVKCPGGYGSTAIYQGVNDDGSVAYYIYAIGFDEMLKGGSVSKDNVKATPEEKPDVPDDGTDKPDAPDKQEKPSRRASQKLPQTGDEPRVGAAILALLLAGCVLLAMGSALRRRA